MDSDTTSRSVRIPTFDGEKKNYAIWNARFQAYAGMQGFDAAIQEKAEENLPKRADIEIDESTAEGKKHVLAKKRNAYAFEEYTLAFTSEELLSKIESAKTEEWLGGLAYLVTKALAHE